MFQQYPHIMVVATVMATTTRDSSGNWLPDVAEEEPGIIKCRYSTKDGSGYVQSESGTQIGYDAIVYMPLPVNSIPLGASVVITEDGLEIAKGTVKHFHKGQLNARIWI